MDLNTLRLFLTVAEQGNFTRAAVKLGVSQPSLSRHIQRLETDLNGPLFYRDGRGVALTDAGKRLYFVAEDVLRQVRDLREALSGQDRQPRGKVVLGLPPSLGATISASLFSRFRKNFPEARLHIVEGFSGTLLEWLEMGQTDATVLYDARRTETITTTPLMREYLYMVEQASGTDKTKTANVSELGKGGFVLSGSGNGLRRVVDAAVRRAGVSMTVEGEIDSVAALKQLVAKGPQRTILPLGAVKDDLRTGRLAARRFADPDMQALLVVATPLRRPVTKLTVAVLALIRAEIRACLSAGVLAGQMEKASSPRRFAK